MNWLIKRQANWKRSLKTVFFPTSFEKLFEKVFNYENRKHLLDILVLPMHNNSESNNDYYSQGYFNLDSFTE